MNRILFLLTFLILGLSRQGFTQQVEPISFSETSFDFGKINEADGPVTHEFTFVNNTIEPIQILNVKASCGCTTPAWTREPVAPGESGMVQAQYNPKNRPGVFNKSLTLTTSLGQPIRLYIKGNVQPRQRTVEEELAFELGGVRMKYSSLNLGKVYVNQPAVTKKFDVYNQSDETIGFLEKMILPKHITLDFEPQMLEPKQYGQLIITYDGQLKNDLGFMNEQITFFTNEKEELSQKNVTIYTTLEEYFKPMSAEEASNAPKLKFVPTEHDFGRVKPNTEVTADLYIYNNGQSNLEIRKVSPNCTCVVGRIENETIKPGESARLTVTFNTSGRKGNQQKSVTVYSNDPFASAQRITIKAYIED